MRMQSRGNHQTHYIKLSIRFHCEYSIIDKTAIFEVRNSTEKLLFSILKLIFENRDDQS